MNIIASFREDDVFPDRGTGVLPVFEDRVTGKAVVFDYAGNVALIGNSANDFYLLPGGGIDDGEFVEEGVIRECREEIGCHVVLKHGLGIVEDYRNRDKKHCISHGFIAELVGEKGTPQLTEEEAKNGLIVVWKPLEEAIALLENQAQQLKRGEVTFYNTGFNILRDRLFLLGAREHLTD